MTTPQFMPILGRGNHDAGPEEGACFMEFASYLAGEEWSDHPRCAHPLLAAVSITVNDHISDDQRQRLLPLVTRVIGTSAWNNDRNVYEGMFDYANRHGVGINPTFRMMPVSNGTWSQIAVGLGIAAVSRVDADRVRFVTEMYDEFDRLAGRTPDPVEKYTESIGTFLTLV
jgi:hypothetical protein